MNFQLIGVNHKTAPVDLREHLAIPDRKLPEALQQLLTIPGVSEGMILCTCSTIGGISWGSPVTPGLRSAR